MGKRKRSGKKNLDSGRIHKNLYWLYVAVFGAAYIFAVFFFAGTKIPAYDLVFFFVMSVINFLILGYSLRIKNRRSRKLVFSGALVLLGGFVLYYLLTVYQDNASFSAFLGFPVDIFMTAGYLLLLFGLKAVMKK